MPTILLKRSITPTNIPTTGNLQIGELAINANDGMLFFRQSGSFGDNIISCITSANSSSLTASYAILTNVSSSLNFANDTLAAAGGVPLGGLYRNGNVIQIRIS